MNNNVQKFQFYKGTHLKYLLDAYKLLICSYYKLLFVKYEAYNCNENKIRDDLVQIAKKLPSKLIYNWKTESRNLANKSQIDIELITFDSLKDDKMGIKIECKIVKSGSEYIDTNGIISFISGKYAAEMPLAGMVGFIKKGNIDDKINKIKRKIDKHKTIKTIKKLSFFLISKKFEYSFISQHKRIKRLPKIDLYHLFFDFS